VIDYEISNPFVVLNPFSREKTLKICSQQWFSPKLEKAGFVSFRNEGLSWYRVIDQELLQCVYLFTTSSLLPASLVIGYACHPFYLKPPIPQKLLIRDHVHDELLTAVYLPTPQRQTGALLCPDTDEHGAEVLDQIILPKLNQINTFEDAYAMHKQYWLDMISNYQREYQVTTLPPGQKTSISFAIETVVTQDEEMLPICIAQMEQYVQRLDEGLYSSKQEKRFNACRPLLMALKGEKRDEYLLELDRQKKQFIRRFTKLTGIEV